MAAGGRGGCYDIIHKLQVKPKTGEITVGVSIDRREAGERQVCAEEQ